MYDPKLHSHLYRQLDQLKKGQTKSKNGQAHFELRLASNYPTLYELLGELYGSRMEIQPLVEEVVLVLHNYYKTRKADLKKLDIKREKNPDWLLNQKWVGMMLYVDHFAEDLKGLKGKITYLEELGVNFLHLMPLLKCPDGENDGGYAVSDFQKVEPRLGSMDDIVEITKEFRKKDILLGLDFVMNHTSDEHDWAEKAKSGDPKYQEYYFMFDNRDVPDQFEQTMPEVFPEAAPGNFSFDEASGKWVMTQFHNYQWDLNYYNPQVLIEMLSAALFLANQGVDILRLDAVPFVWKKLGTACRNEYECHVILRLFKACFQIVAPGVAFIAEAIVRPHEIMKYFGEGKYSGRECDIAYNATSMALYWEALASGETNLLQRVTSNIPEKPYRTTWINYLRSHDDIGLGFDDEDIYALGINAIEHRKFLIEFYSGKYPGSTAMGAPFGMNHKTGDARISGTLAALTGLEKAIELDNQELIDVAIGRILMLQAIVLAYGGLPMLYSGNEIGLPNDYSYQKDKEKSYDNRWMHRPLMDWKAAERRNKKGTVEHRLFHGMKHLIKVRKSLTEFADLNSFKLEPTENKHIFSFLRWDYNGNRTLVLANFFNGNQFVKQEILHRIGLNTLKLKDAISQSTPTYFHDLIELQPYQCYWLRESSS
ncbi:MAG: amylosucrase [Cyclobacteriaceae bacterium]